MLVKELMHHCDRVEKDLEFCTIGYVEIMTFWSYGVRKAFCREMACRGYYLEFASTDTLVLRVYCK